MRINHLFTSTLAATALLLASCATQQSATNTTADDVYNTTAQARVYKYSPPAQPSQMDTTTNSGYTASNPNYDMDYSSRIDRFYYGNNRAYFDDYYNFYGYNTWYNPYGFSPYLNVRWGFNRWYNPYDSWGYYGSPYYSNRWGPYSYYDPYYGGGYYGGGYYGNGNWGGNVIVRNNDNYRPRPTRADNGSSTQGGRYNGTSVPSRGNTNDSGIARPTRVEGYNPTTNGTVNRPTTTQSTNPSSARPSRETQSRPPASGEAPPVRPTYTPPPSPPSTPPPTSSGSSSGESSGGRPTRTGGRG